MDKGIRPAAIVKFNAALPNRVNTREGNTIFRKGIIASLEEEYGCTHAAGATHYNHAFIEARKAAATNPELAALLVGLGRPEDKKGGRKPKAKPEAAPTTPANALLQNFIKAGVVPGAQPPAAVVTAAAAAVGIEGLEQQEEEQPPAEQTVFTVRKKADDSVVAEGLSFEDAKQLVEKAAAAKKAKLYWV